MTKPELEDLVTPFTMSAICGVSKKQLTRSFKKIYKLNDIEIKELIELCRFKKKPENINYKYFYENPISTKAKKLDYPYTQMYSYENFLSEEICLELIENINKTVRSSTIANDKDEQITSNYRTSQTADLEFFPAELILDVNEKLENLMELDMFLGEALQAQKYNPGQYYKKHWDFFPPEDNKQHKVYCEWMGQRTWTTMIYLNDVQNGGETYFKSLDLKIKPKRGLLLAWNNLYRNGDPNYKTKHEALPPKNEDKYVITKWWRSWSLL